MSISESLICHQCGERVPGDYVVCPYCGYSLVQILRQQFKVKVTIFESWGRIYRLLRYPRRTPEWMDQIATNYDIFLSFYSNSIGLLTLGGFYKEIDDLIYERQGHKILNAVEEGYPREL